MWRKPGLDGDFDRWVSGSKVRGTDGRPLIVFHGTDRNFSANNFYPGSHFGSLAAALQSVDRLIEEGGCAESARVIPVFLSLQNPLPIKDVGTSNALGVLLRLRDAGFVERRCFRHFSQKWRGLDDCHQAATEAHRIALIARYLRRINCPHDGLVYQNSIEDPGSWSWTIFHPSQVRPVAGRSHAGELFWANQSHIPT